MHRLLPHLLLLISLTAHSQSTAPTLKNLLTGYEWEWRTIPPNGGASTLRFLPDHSVQHPWPNLGSWRWQVVGDHAEITPRGASASATPLILKFNPEFSEFRTLMADGKTQVRGLRSKLIGHADPSSPTMPPGIVPKPRLTMSNEALSAGYGGMTLTADWMPRSSHIKAKELQQIEFYAKAAVGDAAPGKEPTPAFIVPPFKWLMPLEDALKALPPGAKSVPTQPFQNDCFPHGCLNVKCMQFTYFVDMDMRFNLMYLITDAKNCLVSVQLKAEAIAGSTLKEGTTDDLRAMHPPYPGFSPKHDGQGGLYYDFFNEGTGSPTYQLRFNQNHSNTLVHLLFSKKNVHWYLPAPFARCLIDIAEHHRAAGLIK